MKTITVETNQGELVMLIDKITTIEQPILSGFGGATLGKYPITVNLIGKTAIKTGRLAYRELSEALDANGIDSIEITDNNRKVILVKSTIVAIARDHSQKKVNEQVSSVVKITLNDGTIISGIGSGYDLFENLKRYLENDQNQE